MAEDKLPYDQMVQDAMRDVLRRTLTQVAKTGLPGAHHLYITFRTSYPGVEIPDHLRASYPSDMTIVLQHQFYGLEVTEAMFQVTLSFRKRAERLRIPFAAVVAFVDPAVNFGLQFQVPDAEPTRPVAAFTGAASVGSGSASSSPLLATDDEPAAEEGGESKVEKVVSLDAFRKK
jgi:uncharacterized protein